MSNTFLQMEKLLNIPEHRLKQGIPKSKPINIRPIYYIGLLKEGIIFLLLSH